MLRGFLDSGYLLIRFWLTFTGGEAKIFPDNDLPVLREAREEASCFNVTTKAKKPSVQQRRRISGTAPDGSAFVGVKLA